MTFGISILLAASFLAAPHAAADSVSTAGAVLAAADTAALRAFTPSVAARAHGSSTDSYGSSTDTLGTYTFPPFTVYGKRLGLDWLAPFGATLRRRDQGEIPASGGVVPLIEAAPGVEVRRQGGPGAPAWLAVRGSNAEQVLVLVDGMPLNTAQGGGVDLAMLPSEGIGAAEIFRGPAAALWGAGALAGVVHLMTLPRAFSETSVTAERGSFGSASISGSMSEVRGTSSLLARAGHARSRGDFRYDDGRHPEARERENAGFGRDHAGLDFRHDGSARRWESRLSFVSARRGMPGTVEFPSSSAAQEDREIRGLLALRPLDPSGWPGRAGVEVTLLDRTRHYEDPLPPWGPVSERHHSRRLESRFLWSASGARTALEASLSPSLETLESTSDGRRTRRGASAVARFEQAFGPADGGDGARGRAAATLRADATTSFGSSLDPAIGLSYDIVRDCVALSASAARTHRVPSFDDLFWPASALVAGNPDLHSESAASVDAGVRVRAGGAGLTAGVFRSDVTGLIQWAPSGGGRWRPHNVGRAIIRGLEGELSAARALGGSWRARAMASGTLLEARDRSEGGQGGQLPRRPRLWGVATAALERGEWSLRVTVDAMSRRYLNEANTKAIAAHTTAGLVLHAPLLRQLAAEIEVQNLTDKPYVDVADYPVPGREWSLRVRYAHRHGGER